LGLAHLSTNKATNGIYSSALSRIFNLCVSGERQELIEELIEGTEQRIRNLKITQGRLIYFLSSIGMVLLNLIVTILLSQLIANNISFYSVITLCGSLGSLFSVALNLNKINIDIDAPWGINVISGSSRIVIGMVGAIFTYFLVKSNLVLGLINQANSDYGSSPNWFGIITQEGRIW
jgi:hypothetical protein